MIRVRFVAADGTVVEMSAAPGDRLLDVAQAAGQPLEGTCGGQMACSTCHVIVAPADFAALPEAGEDEASLLDMVPAATRTSRLACQVRLPAGCDAFTVRIPA